MKQPELLAPAGDLECVRAALYFGADAVYVGGPQLQLRADKVGFTMETLAQAVQLVHHAGKRIYITVNSFLRNEEIPQLTAYAKALRDLGADALIVSDIGAMSIIREAASEIELHVSTQANCQNYAAARVYHNMGAKRVVLARELSLEDIALVRANVPDDLELEAFVHGAMCMSYSGRCMLSAYFNSRSGNRGDCSQPCRWQYHVAEKTRPGVYLPVEEDDQGTAIFSAHDLCCISFLDKIAAAGVCSFKIEGRMKTPFYVATVVNAYRHAMDGTATLSELQRELDSVSHRPYGRGFYYGDAKTELPNDGSYLQDTKFAAVVQHWENGVLTVQQRNRFSAGDELEVISPAGLGLKFTAEQLRDHTGALIDNAPHPMQTVTMNCPLKLREGDILRLRIGGTNESV